MLKSRQSKIKERIKPPPPKKKKKKKKKKNKKKPKKTKPNTNITN